MASFALDAMAGGTVTSKTFSSRGRRTFPSLHIYPSQVGFDHLQTIPCKTDKLFQEGNYLIFLSNL